MPRFSLGRLGASNVGLFGATVLGFWLGQGAPLPGAFAQQPAPPVAPANPAEANDYSQRVVAYIYGTVPITRQELGEYLIARYGADRLELLVNKKIIETACARQGITVSAAEIDQALQEDCKSIGVDKAGFVKNVLKRYGKTLLEWKEDVLKPRLLMLKLCLPQVKVTEDDLRKEFESRYGMKVQCRFILYPHNGSNLHAVEEVWKRAHEKGLESFEREARSQPNPTLASQAGRIQPIARYAAGDDTIEKVAFSLKPGEQSQIIDTKQGYVILFCESQVPAVKGKTFEVERAALQREVVQKKAELMIPQLFKQMHAQADPKLLIKRQTEEALLSDVRKELGMKGGTAVGKPATPPAGAQAAPAPGHR